MPSCSPNVRSKALELYEHHNSEWRRVFAFASGLKEFQPAMGGVFACSYMKSGTTLMQQMVYNMMVACKRVPTDPDGLDFHDISAVVPLAEFRHSTGVFGPEHPYQPTAWKTHMLPDDFHGTEIGKNAKFIYCFREGKAVIRSYADFTVDWIAKEKIDDEDVRAELYRLLWLRDCLGRDDAEDGGPGKFIGRTNDWFRHIRKWFNTTVSNILYVPYEDLVKDMRTWIIRIGNFIGLGDELGEEQIEFVLSRCDKEYMSKDPRINSRLVSKMTGWNMDLGVRARDEKSWSFKRVKLPEYCYEEFDKQFAEELGEGGYASLLEQARKKNEAAGV